MIHVQTPSFQLSFHVWNMCELKLYYNELSYGVRMSERKRHNFGGPIIINH